VADTLREFFISETSRRNTDLISSLIIQKPEIFNEIMELALANEEPVSRRAAWVADACSEKQPELLVPWIDKIAGNLPYCNHDGLKRHSLRMLSRSPLPVDRPGELISICFEWLTTPSESVAVKVYCMEILYRVSLDEPGIRQELADSIEWRFREETPGFRSKASKILKKLSKE
jgi:hypothetical protein